MDTRPIGIFDSGRGGINLLMELKKLLPSERFIYVSDVKFCPYGDKDNAYVKGRIFSVFSRLDAMNIKAFIIACNTATAVGIEELRKYTSKLVFGVEPAIRACKRACKNDKALVLATATTVCTQRFKQLLEKCGKENFIVLPLKTLASSIENNLDNLSRIREEIESAVSGYTDIKYIVLGCTHYRFILDILKEIFPIGAIFFDGLKPTAEHIFSVLTAENLLSGKSMIEQDLFLD